MFFDSLIMIQIVSLLWALPKIEKDPAASRRVLGADEIIRGQLCTCAE
jgi:hypothetical protein